jgi:hypothetical protein
MATDRTARFAVPAAAALLLWPALWNGYPIVFADTGTYLSQAIHRYAGWDRPVFYSLFMLPLHATVTVWPVIAAQALLASRVLWLVCRVLLPGLSGAVFLAGAAVLAVTTWLPWIVSELMPDLFTPLLVLVLGLLALVPDWLARWERLVLAGLATFMIATQQSSLPLACALVVAELALGMVAKHRDAAACVPAPFEPFDSPWRGDQGFQWRRPVPGRQTHRFPALVALVLPPALAVLALCTANLAAHGRFTISPFGNIFLLARVIYDGPGMATIRRDCATERWRLCPFADRFPATSDDFLWAPDSPLYQAGGPKRVSEDAGAMIRTTLRTAPAAELQAALANTLEQLSRFSSGDGLNPWPVQVTPPIERDFPAREAAAYASALQQTGALAVPPALATLHRVVALAGVAGCLLLLPVALWRRSPCAWFLLVVLLTLPVSAAITGALSAPHDRYQARIMWLPPFIAVLSVAALRTRTRMTPPS